MHPNITFRTQLLGGVTEFCQQSGIPLITNPIHLVELVVLLARFKEEGVSLCPKVYLTNNMDTLASMLPEVEKLCIGRAASDIQGIKLATKKCAPLAIGGWLIYIHDKQQEIEFGLFKGSSNPISVSVDDVIMETSEDLLVVKAFQIAEECVEIRSNNGSFHYVFLNHRKEDSPPPLQFLNDLVISIVDDVDLKEKESVTSFLKKLFFEALRQSHGCIVAVTNMKHVPKFLSDDGTILDHPINYTELVCNTKNNTISQFCLDNNGYLLKGMLNTDGIIIFDNKARLLGYNCFIKNSKNIAVIGGARKRAFASLSSKIGKGLCAVFMQSQDGWSDFKGKSNE